MARTTPTPTPMQMEQFFGGVQQQEQQEQPQQQEQRRGAAADAAERSHDDVWGPNSAEWGRAMVQNYLEATTTTNADDPAAASNNGSIRSTTSRPRIIPHILHFIWLGPKPLPALFETKLLDSWKEHHEGWHVKVWRNRDLEALLQEQQQQQQHAAADALDYALQHGHYGMASDIMRCLVLYKYGGVYVDIDYLCVDSLSSCCLTTTSSCCSTTTTTMTHDLPFDFVCGASNVGGGCSTIEVNNGILACKPQSALVKLVLKDVSAWFQQVARPLTLVSAFLGNTHAASSTMSNSLLTDEDVIRHTGPGVWTRILGQVLLQQQEQQQQQQQEQQEPSSVLDEQIMVFPYSVFHPMPNTDRHFVKWQEYEDEDECERGVLDAIVDRYAIPGMTKAIHLWQCTWQQQAHQTNRNRDDIDDDDETMIV